MPTIAQEVTFKFGTDGWRGIIADDFTVRGVEFVTQAVCDLVLSGSEKTPGTGIVVGYDRRAQSEVFGAAAARVVAANGIPVYLTETACTSPMVSFACVDRKAAAGIMITASHNPPQFNGFKIKGYFGGSAIPEMVREIETSLAELLRSGREPRRSGVAPAPVDLSSRFLEHCRDFVDAAAIRNAGFKVIVDPMHGSGAGYLTGILRDWGVDVTEIRGERNPYFGGVNPEPIDRNMEALFEAVRVAGADVGICMDGDADRIGACDSQGRYVDCHRLIAILLRHLVERKQQRGTVIRTVSVSRMIDKLCAHYDLVMREVPIGFKNIADIMLREDVLIGGEESGGIGIKGHIPERDGILMGLVILEAMAVSGKRLEELLAEVFDLTGAHEFARTDLHLKAERMPAVLSLVRGLEAGEFAGAAVRDVFKLDGSRLDFTDGSWLLLRPSGTEPVVRVYAEAATMERARQLVDEGVSLLENTV
ncbi:MAG: phosphoglucomutase/phosphomannomutase family protein [Capsulimonadales bacterium]|nr:phosphoglucomutase/phosphomannomutase family protein [Capsulimonadales bacterium]